MKLKGDTEPPTNVLYKNRDLMEKYTSEYLDVCRIIRKTNLAKFKKHDLVKFHKKALGKQLTCWNGEYRYWVWEGLVKVNKHHTATWRIFVSNTKGICFETNTGREDAIMLCWEDYRKKIGV